MDEVETKLAIHLLEKTAEQVTDPVTQYALQQAAKIMAALQEQITDMQVEEDDE